MIIHFLRRDEYLGCIRCHKYTNHQGKTDLNAYFCPGCGSIYARGIVEWEPGESPAPYHYHVISGSCGGPIWDLRDPHPTFWNCADQLLLTHAFMEYLNEHTCLNPTAGRYPPPEDAGA